MVVLTEFRENFNPLREVIVLVVDLSLVTYHLLQCVFYLIFHVAVWYAPSEVACWVGCERTYKVTYKVGILPK